MNCEFCQSPVHIWFDCPKKPNGWKPARLADKREPAPSSDCKSDALTKEGLAAASSNLGAPTKSTAPKGEGIVPRRSAKSTSLPVDTNSVLANAALAQTVEASDLKSDRVSVQTREAAPKFNRAEWYRKYMKLYMRDRRAKEREAKNV